MSRSVSSLVRNGLIALTLGTAAFGAQAGLVGSTVGCGVNNTWSCSSASATVTDPGVEFAMNLFGQLHFDIDFANASLTLTWAGPGGLGMGAGEIFSFSGLTSVTGVSGFSSVGESGFTLADVSFNGGTLDLLMNGSSWSEGNSATISFDTTDGRIPEPASLALVGLGFLAAGLARRRKRS